MNTITACYFPTQLLLISKDQNLLNIIQNFLKNKYKIISVSQLENSQNFISNNDKWLSQLVKIPSLSIKAGRNKSQTTIDIPLTNEDAINNVLS